MGTTAAGTTVKWRANRVATPCSRTSRAIATAGYDVDNLSADVLASVDHVHVFESRNIAAGGRGGDRRRRRRPRRRVRHGRPSAYAGDTVRLPTCRCRHHPELCEVAAELNRRSGLDDLIEIRRQRCRLTVRSGRIHRRLDPARVGTIHGQGAHVRGDAQGTRGGWPAGLLRRAHW